jgi:hypothetical protein
MSIDKTTDQGQDILDALRKIQDSAELKLQAATNLQSVLNLLGLSGVARRAVAFSMVNGSGEPAPDGLGFW